MSKRVFIVECEVGNLFSISQALQYWGAETVITRDRAEIEKADRLLLPGVGSFGDAMAEISHNGLTDTLLSFVETGRPLLGICVGMQLLMERGTEYGTRAGLGLFVGEVTPIPDCGHDGEPIRLPHIGWQGLTATSSWETTILDGIDDGSAVYFAHSYRAELAHQSATLAQANVGSVPISAVIQNENVAGCQFHPEKSGTVGLKIMKNFIEM